MPPRPAIKPRESRPISAIYLGTAANASGSSSGHPPPPSSSASYAAYGTPPNLPELPEPPSPASSVRSSNSGLPSPPATNSTGSGSTGDAGSIALRQRPLSLASDSSASTSGSSHRTLPLGRPYMLSTPAKRSSSRQSQQLLDEELPTDVDPYLDDHEPDFDGDHTARLDRRPHHDQSSNDNVLALQRVKNLTERNRMAIDKLTRLNSPQPGSSRGTHSPAPSQRPSSISPRKRRAQPLGRHEVASGSETERESVGHSHSSSSSSRRPITPPPPSENARVNIVESKSSPYNRLRHVSAPSSPQKARVVSTSASSSSNSPGQRRHRASSTTTPVYQYDDESEDPDSYASGRESRFSTATGTGRGRGDTVRDVTQSALAAVASSRRSPLTTRRRGMLPKEFREGNESSTDASSVFSEARRTSPERRRQPAIEPVTPHRNATRSSTLRETARSGGPSTSRYSKDQPPTPPSDRVGRRATLRGGSAESVLKSPNGRTLVGEGLRAVGLQKREAPKTFGRTASTSSTGADVFKEREVKRKLDWHAGDEKLKRRATVRERAATSMDNYRSLDSETRERDRQRLKEQAAEDDRVLAERERALQNHHSSGSRGGRGVSLSRRHRDLSLTRAERDHLELDRNSQPPSTAFPNPATAAYRHLQSERQLTSSPFTSMRTTTPFPGGNDAAGSGGGGTVGEHVRLMIDSLKRFEGNITKLPESVFSGASVPSADELLRHAQNVVFSTERINAMLRLGTHRAVEEQIAAEVADGDALEPAQTAAMLDVWRMVGAEYREGLRASDELVRALTAFLMDVGVTMRKMGGSGGMLGDSPATHARTISLEEDGVRAYQQAGRESRSGRRSVVSGEISDSRNGRVSVLSGENSDSRNGRRSVISGEYSASGRRSVVSGEYSFSGRMSVEQGAREREMERERRKELQREDALRKLGGGTGTLGRNRGQSLGVASERERGGTYDSPSPGVFSHRALPPLTTNLNGIAKKTVLSAGSPQRSPQRNASTRRLYTPSQQRERQLDGEIQREERERVDVAPRLRPSESQKTLTGYKDEMGPSPTPEPKGERLNRDLPDLPSRRPLPDSTERRTVATSQASSNTRENDRSSNSHSIDRRPLDRGFTERNSPDGSTFDRGARDRRSADMNTISTSSHSEDRSTSAYQQHQRVTSIATVRASTASTSSSQHISPAPSFPGLTTPSTVTTSVFAHTVSNSPTDMPPSLAALRTNSSRSARSTVTFSRPARESVNVALSGIQAQAREDDLKRKALGVPDSAVRPASGSTSSGGVSDVSRSPEEPRREITEVQTREQPRKLAAIALARVQSTQSAQSGSETERPREPLLRRTTTLNGTPRALGLGAAATVSPRLSSVATRSSLDGRPSTASGYNSAQTTGRSSQAMESPFGRTSTAHAADRAATALSARTTTNSSRRNVQEIWSSANEDGYVAGR